MTWPRMNYNSKDNIIVLTTDLIYKTHPILKPAITFSATTLTYPHLFKLIMWNWWQTVAYINIQQVQSNISIYLESCVSSYVAKSNIYSLLAPCREISASVDAKCLTMFTSCLLTVSVSVWRWAGSVQSVFRVFFPENSCLLGLKVMLLKRWEWNKTVKLQAGQLNNE